MNIEVMISYSQKDQKFTHTLKKALEEMGFSVILDEHNIPFGANLAQTIQELIYKCHYLLIAITPNSIKSDWVRWELNLGLSYEKQFNRVKVLPILIHGNEVPTELVDRLYVDFRTSELLSKNFRKLVWQLSRPNQESVWQTVTLKTEKNSNTSNYTGQSVNFEKINKENLINEKGITINSPMVGTIYRSASPEKPPYLRVGDRVEKGDVVCIIEAMKLFNEIESEIKGEVVKVYVEDGQPVEYDQPLFLILPE